MPTRPRSKNDRWKYALAPVCAIALVSTGGVAKTGTRAKTRPPNANVQVAANVPPKVPSAYIQIAANSSRINTTGRDITITVPMNNGLPLGQVDITITPDNVIFVKADDLIAALSRNLLPSELDRLAKLADARGRISAADLATAGYPISYDTASSTLQIALRLDGQRTIDINLGNSGSQAEVLDDKSANFAAFLNYRAGETYTFTGPYEGRMAFLGDLELGGRIGQTVSFDNYGSLDQRNPNVFTRSSSRLIYDWPGPALRITAGDLLTDTTAFQSGPQIAGLNISHLMSTFYPSFDMSGAGNQNLVLTHASDVQIIVNNLPVSQLHLQPGTYNLRNLAMSQGSNNIKAIVTDDTGARRVVDFSYFSDANLLAPGLDEYTISAGILAPYGRHGPDYLGNAPVMSGYYRRGVTEQLTAGVNLQAGRYDQMLGLDAVFGTNIGLFSLNVAGNHLRYDVPGAIGNQQHDDVLGAAGRLQYRFLEQGDNVYDNRSFNASVEYRSPHFGSMASGLLYNDQAFLFSADLSQPITGDFSLQVSGNYATYRSHRENTGAVSGFVNWSAPYDMDLGVGLTYQWSPRPIFGQPDLSGRGLSFAITLTKRIDETTMVQASGDRFNQRASITRSPTRQLDDWFASGDVGRSRDGYSGSANLGYETNRGDVQAAYSTGLNGDGRIVNQTLGGIFTGSVAFADGHVGLGRSISDSFAIVDADPSLGNSRVVITDGFADNVSARSDALGPAVVRLNSYNKQTIPYDVDDLPAGYNLGDGNFAAYPWYHSGAAFTVGSPYNVSAIGTIVDASGAPVTLQTGEAISLDDPTAPHVPVVTNRTGHFAVIGLAPGRWRMTMSGGAAYVLTVRKEDGMLLKLGTVSPTP